MIELLPGDVFCSYGNMFIVSSLIRWTETVLSKDDAAHYGHAGIILDSQGATLEALWSVRVSNLSAYTGQQLLIARPKITDEYGCGRLRQQRALDVVNAHAGRMYPPWRIPLHLVPPLAKYLSGGRYLVCSELVAKYLTLAGARYGPYAGINPDDLADMFIHWRNFDVLYEGVWGE